MNRPIKYRRLATVISTIGACVLLLAQCVNNDPTQPPAQATKPQPPAAPISPVTRAQFAGSEACASCHKAIYASHIHTPHYLTTRPANATTIKGSFLPGHNTYAYDSTMVVKMESTDSGFYQAGYYNGEKKIARRFDIVVGSNSKGQTYLTRDGDHFYQLPVSYFTAAHEWANSPLFPTHPVLFNRPITARCLECHTTFAQRLPDANRQLESFDPNTILYGVDCEKCHGPGAQHVAFQSQHPEEKAAKFILNPKKFTRQQSLDLCILCHGGRLQKTKPSFSFISGDTITKFFAPNNTPANPDEIDVHGNQYGLLSASKCFRQSQTMTCNTCHDSHTNERGKIALFSQRCASCHSTGHSPVCRLTATKGATALATNCIDCHMPLQPSHSITELLPGHTSPTAAMIRSHYIAIYAQK